MTSLKLLQNLLSHSIFWGWNLVFLTVVYCGILPFVGIWLIVATFEGTVPLDFGLTLLALIAVPTACTIYGIRYLRNRPRELMRWFYGVEAPLVVWCLVRLFIIRELTLASSLILGTLLICIVAFAIEMLQGYQANRRMFSWLQAIAHTLMLFTGVYLGTVLLFYALPVAVYIVGGVYHLAIAFFSFDWIEGFWRSLSHGANFLLLLGLMAFLFGFSSALFIGMPFAVTKLYIDSGKKIVKAFARQHGRSRATQVAVTVVCTWLVLFNIFNVQPQVKAFDLLSETRDRAELLASASKIRRGLVNANLYPYRYLSTREGNNHIYAMYDGLGLPKSLARFFQQRYNQLLSPFLYQGSRQDVERSARLYAEFFDAPLQQAERKSVRHAIQSTAIVDRAEAGLLNIDQKKVWLAKQEVNIAPHGDWADVEIHEVYENQTNDVEEILYYFSLPESATITGLWLGETEDLSQRFAYQISPRGAAQEVYKAQVRRTRPVDPALLEQVGPRQYRLRAFPVPPKRPVTRNGIDFDSPQMHLWLTYKVLQQDRGWALPQLAEQRNIYWTGFTRRIRNGKTRWFFPDVWLEDFASEETSTQRTTHQLNLASGYTVTLTPDSHRIDAIPQNQKYALILDTSYSMENQRDEVERAIRWLQENSIESNNDLDLYITDASSNQARRLANIRDLNLNKLVFFGSLQIEQMLQQFQLLREAKNYDAVLLLTDEGSYELSPERQQLVAIDCPLWLVHLGGSLPKAYNDTVLQAIQNSYGGIAQNIPTAIERLATKADDTVVVDGYQWAIAESDTPTNSYSGLEPLAARQLVSYLSEKNHPLTMPQLDAIHHIAREQGIVTPYSSAIVLVNDRQREQLKAAEARSDRFKREVETGVEQLDTPFNPFESAESTVVSGVPEPDIWILLAIATLAWLLVFQRQARIGNPTGGQGEQ